MVDREEAASAWNLTSMGNGQLKATITGNLSSSGIETQDNDTATSGNNSAVAMSILYSITGLITLLFLVIIATGAIRAHRYPERYGPRSGYRGQPGQSRARGLARAVLETLPIVKFGSPEPAKPDPAIELESGPPVDRLPERPGQAHLSTIREEPETPRRNMPPLSAPGAEQHQGIGPDSQAANSEHEAGSHSDSDLGCSICTEDFKVGEDVRVLPCNHKFHPACVDPWLINVSGTCPLCRLDLSANSEKRDSSLPSPDQLLPPLSELEAAEQFAQGSRRRSSRFLDLHRLRHASVEERIEGLRRFRTEEQNEAGPAIEEDRTRRARLAERLRERFRIRTRAQSPDLPHASP